MERLNFPTMTVNVWMLISLRYSHTSLSDVHFNTILRRRVAWIRSSLLVKYNGENIIIYLNMDVVLFGPCNHVIKMMQRVDPHAEGGRILIKEVLSKR